MIDTADQDVLHVDDQLDELTGLFDKMCGRIVIIPFDNIDRAEGTGCHLPDINKEEDRNESSTALCYGKCARTCCGNCHFHQAKIIESHCRCLSDRNWRNRDFGTENLIRPNF